MKYLQRMNKIKMKAKKNWTRKLLNKQKRRKPKSEKIIII